MKKIFAVDNINYLNSLYRFSTVDELFSKEIKLFIYKNKAIIIPSTSKIITYNNHVPHIKVGEIEYKYCPICKKWRSLFAFIKNKFTPDKLKNICAECDNKQRRERYAKTKAIN